MTNRPSGHGSAGHLWTLALLDPPLVCRIGCIRGAAPALLVRPPRHARTKPPFGPQQTQPNSNNVATLCRRSHVNDGGAPALITAPGLFGSHRSASFVRPSVFLLLCGLAETEIRQMSSTTSAASPLGQQTASDPAISNASRLDSDRTDGSGHPLGGTSQRPRWVQRVLGFVALTKPRTAAR